MSPRKLSRQQRLRIERRQEASARRADTAARTADETLAGGDLGPEARGRVIARYGRQADVAAADGRVHRCHLRANLESPVAGDEVTFCAGEGEGVIVAVAARRTELRRPDKFGNLRAVAANIDQVVIVIAPTPEPHANLIDRYLVATENLGAEATLLLNKTDLLDDPAKKAAMEALLAPYPPLGYTLLQASARVADLPRLEEALAGRTSILVGQSGVGKTTLVNALLPELRERTGALSPDRAKGRHTTTTARLFPTRDGGALIDSPGIREFGLWHLDRTAVERGFREFRDRIGPCRFRDCQHSGEPGCALEAALEEGAIHPARLDSYRRIIASLDELV